MIDPHVSVSGEIAIPTFALQNFDAEDRPASRWLSTEIFKKRGDDWKLLHSHWTIVKK